MKQTLNKNTHAMVTFCYNSTLIVSLFFESQDKDNEMTFRTAFVYKCLTYFLQHRPKLGLGMVAEFF